MERQNKEENFLSVCVSKKKYVKNLVKIFHNFQDNNSDNFLGKKTDKLLLQQHENAGQKASKERT